MDLTPSPEYVKKVRQEKWDNLEWTPKELFFRNRAQERRQYFQDNKVCFYHSAWIKFKGTHVGTFLDIYNYQQKQDKMFNENKMGIYKKILKEEMHPDELKRLDAEDNNLTDDLFEMLETAVKYSEKIDVNYGFKVLLALRIQNFYIEVIDRCLSQFKALQVLVLTLNFIKDIPGKYLPRKLKFLELFGNYIEDVKCLCEKAPRRVLHLGLCRNKLTNRSHLHLLSQTKSYAYLRTLDLSENDIYSLIRVLETIKKLVHLYGLLLEGNPCSVNMSLLQRHSFVLLPKISIFRRSSNPGKRSKKHRFRKT